MIEEQVRTGEQEERDAVAPGMDDMLSLDDDEWRAVLAALPALVSARARNGERTRAFVDAVLWIAATGRPWVQLSSSAGPWHSVYVRFTRWAHEGLWDKVIVASMSDPKRQDCSGGWSPPTCGHGRPKSAGSGLARSAPAWRRHTARRVTWRLSRRARRHRAHRATGARRCWWRSGRR